MNWADLAMGPVVALLIVNGGAPCVVAARFVTRGGGDASLELLFGERMPLSLPFLPQCL